MNNEEFVFDGSTALETFGSSEHGSNSSIVSYNEMQDDDVNVGALN